MPDKPRTVTQYLAALPKERRDALRAVRQVILENLDTDYAEGLQYGSIGYFVPHAVYPAGYHADPSQPLPFVGLASQKHHMAVYLFGLYTSETEQRWFREAWAKTGKKLDMGKSCVRFRKLEDVPLDLIGKAIKRSPARKFIARYEATLGQRRRGSGSATRSSTHTARKKTPAGKRPTKRTRSTS